MAVDTTEVSRIELLNSAVADKSGLPVRVVSGGAGGGGAATIADGADVAQGSTADATWNGAAAATGISIWRYLGVKLEAIRALLAGTLSIGGNVAVTNFPATQPVSVAATVNVATGLAQPLTDTQLRALAVPVSLAAAPNTPVTNANLDAALSTLASQATLLLIKADTDRLIAAPATEAKQDTANTALAAVKANTDHPTAAAVAAVDYTAISDTTRNIVLLAANAARKGVHLVNTSDQDIPLREGAAASSVAYTRKLRAHSELDLEYPASTAALYGYFSRLPDAPVLITERS